MAVNGNGPHGISVRPVAGVIVERRYAGSHVGIAAFANCWPPLSAGLRPVATKA